jgi:hypothetical protein
LPDLERELRALAEADLVVTRLLTIPGIGLLTATALVGSVGHIHAFRRARQFASWLGLTPREHSSATRRRLGGISKRGDVYLRCLLTHGARAVLVTAQRRKAAAQGLTRLHHWALTVRDHESDEPCAAACGDDVPSSRFCFAGPVLVELAFVDPASLTRAGRWQAATACASNSYHRPQRLMTPESAASTSTAAGGSGTAPRLCMRKA